MNKHRVYDEYLNGILPEIKSPVIFEIGVHVGQDTAILYDMCKSPQYYGFEPDPRNIETFKKTEVYKKINFYEMAVGAYNGKAEFYQSSGSPPKHSRENTGSSSLYKPKKHLDRWPWTTFNNKIIVDICTLDFHCTKFNIKNIDFIWADIQGAEYYMILGGANILKNTKYMFVEYEDADLYEGHKMLSEILNVLPGWGVVKRYPSDVLLKNNII